MNILSDAEYRQLPESGKTAYWRARYEEEHERWDLLRREVWELRDIIGDIRERLDRPNELPQ